MTETNVVAPEKKTILQGLIEEAKVEGLDIAEDAAKDAVRFLFKSAPKLVKLIKNPTIAMIAGLIVTSLSILESKVIELLDKIDGEVEPE